MTDDAALERARVEQAFVDGSVEGSPIDRDGSVEDWRDIVAADPDRMAADPSNAPADRSATVFMVVQTADDQDEAWWVLHHEDTRADAMEAAAEFARILREHHYFPERIEDSKGSRRPEEVVDAV